MTVNFSRKGKDTIKKYLNKIGKNNSNKNKYKSIKDNHKNV